MSGFARGIVAGVHVTQGQVIGYLGQSGLATGPHLHYEVIINGNFVDPMAIKLARTREFDGKMLAAFKHERDRIEQLMAAAPSAASAARLRRPAARRRPPPSPPRSTEPHGETRRARREAERDAQIVGRCALGAQRAERGRGGALRHLVAVGVEHEPMVAVARRRQAEQRLQQAMGRSRGEEVAAPDDVADLLQRVVDDDGEMIARGGVAAAQNEIAPGGGIGDAARLRLALAKLAPRQLGRRDGARARRIEPPAGRLAGGESLDDVARRERPAGPG